MSLLGFSCRPCSAADPINDTVKIDMEAAIREQQEERDTRERIDAEVRAAREAQDLEDQERMRQLEEQDEANARAEAEALARAEATAGADACLKREQNEEEEARCRQEAEEADAIRLAEEQRRVAEEESAEQRQKKLDKLKKDVIKGKVTVAACACHSCRARKKNEASRIAQKAAQEVEMKGKLDKVLKEYGVAEVNQKRKSLMSFKYPLHYAVEKGDAEAVRLLLHFKADASLLNSSKKAALQLAEKGKTKDEEIISMLRAEVLESELITLDHATHHVQDLFSN